MQKLRVLCSSASCAHRYGDGYYGVCQHPTSKQLVPYGGITRMYVGKCDLHERTKQTKG